MLTQGLQSLPNLKEDETWSLPVSMDNAKVWKSLGWKIVSVEAAGDRLDATYLWLDSLRVKVSTCEFHLCFGCLECINEIVCDPFTRFRAVCFRESIPE